MRCLNCYHCGNPATTFNGHVHKDADVLTVGWCRLCKMIGIDEKFEFTGCSQYPSGCLGEWTIDQGISKNLTPILL